MKRSVQNLMGSFLKAQESLKNTVPDQLPAALEDYANRFTAFPWAADYLIRLGDDAMESGDRRTAFLYLDTAYRRFPSAANKVTLYLRLAQCHLDVGNTETGIQFLDLLCTASVDNYEESIEHNGLADVWNRYKHHLPDRAPTLSTKYKPGTFSMQIDKILGLPDADLLSSLSEHLQELSCGGENLSHLNKWERTVFYADELAMEVNSGGFSNYLYYYGHHFSKARQAFSDIGAAKMVALLDRIAEKFPKGTVPGNLNRLQTVLDAMEEQGVDFEVEDDSYYTLEERPMLDATLAYIRSNKHKFR